MKLSRLCTASLAALLGLSFATDAYALSCEEIMNMVNVNVPVPIVVQTIEDSGEQFSVDEVRCLQNEGAPGDVIAAAKALMAGSEPAPVERGDAEIQRERERQRAERERQEEESMLGAGRSGGSQELSDEGASGGSDPEQVKQAIKLFRAKKPLTASLMLYEMLEDNTFPDREAQIEYYLARCLYELEMYHSSQYYFLQVLRKGPSNPYFKHALPKLVPQICPFQPEPEAAPITVKPRSSHSECQAAGLSSCVLRSAVGTGLLYGHACVAENCGELHRIRQAIAGL